MPFINFTIKAARVLPVGQIHSTENVAYLTNNKYSKALLLHMDGEPAECREKRIVRSVVGWGRRLFEFFTPFLIASAYILALYMAFEGSMIFWIVGGAMFAYFFPPLGKESVIPGALFGGIPRVLPKGLLEMGVPPAEAIALIAGSIAFVDIIVGLFLCWNFDLVKKIPLIGRYVRTFERRGAAYLSKRPWIRRLAFIGIVLFVVVPFQGSGAVGATIVGRLIGMKRYSVWLAVVIGALIGCFTIAILAYYFGVMILTFFAESAKYVGLALLAALIAYIIWNYTRRER